MEYGVEYEVEYVELRLLEYKVSIRLVYAVTE
jgi:hypothetical protein